MGSEEISAAKKWFLLGAMIFSGAANTIVYNTQNSTISTVDGGKYKFNHPYMQALTMFIGEFSVILMFLFQKKATAEKRENYDIEKQEEGEALGKSTSWKKYIWLIIPASSDFFTSTLQYIALNYINPSIYQMLRGGVILVTALFSRVFLKRTLHAYMLIGCGIVFVGIGLVGVSNFAFSDGSDGSGVSATAQGIAMSMIIVSLFFNGCLFVSEEFLFGKFYLHAFQVVGTEGFWGICIYSVVLPILSYAKCPLTVMKQGCVVFPEVGTLVKAKGTTPEEYKTQQDNFFANKDNQHNATFENPSLYFKEMGTSAFLSIMVVMGVLTIAVFNVCGVNVTKHISALTRSIADVSRTLIVWIVSLAITFTVGKTHSNYAWENTNGWAILVEGLGFVVLVLGNFIYNGIIRLPFAPPPKGELSDEEEGLLDQKNISLQDQEDVYDEETSKSGSFKKPKAKKSSGRDSFHN